MAPTEQNSGLSGFFRSLNPVDAIRNMLGTETGEFRQEGHGYKKVKSGDAPVVHQTERLTARKAEGRVNRALAGAFNEQGVKVSSARDLQAAMGKHGLPLGKSDDPWKEFNQMLAKQGLRYETVTRDPARKRDTGYIVDLKTGQSVAAAEVREDLSHEALTSKAKLMHGNGRGFGVSQRDSTNGYSPRTSKTRASAYAPSERHRNRNEIEKRLSDDLNKAQNGVPLVPQSTIDKIGELRADIRKQPAGPAREAAEERLKEAQRDAWYDLEWDLKERSLEYSVNPNSGTAELRDMNDKKVRAMAAEVSEGLSHNALKAAIGMSYQRHQKLDAAAKAGAAPSAQSDNVVDLAAYRKPSGPEAAEEPKREGTVEVFGVEYDLDSLYVSRGPEGYTIMTRDEEGRPEEVEMSVESLPEGNYPVEGGGEARVGENGVSYTGVAPAPAPEPEPEPANPRMAGGMKM